MAKGIKFVKVGTRLLESDAARFETVAKRSGFTSDYALLRYLIHVFLRVADPENDVLCTPIPLELAELFTDNAELKKDLEAAYESIRRVTYAHNIQRFNAKAGRTGRRKATEAASNIEAEVSEMFEEYSTEAAKEYFNGQR